MATVKALPRNKLALEPPSAASLTDGQLLSLRALTSRHRCPICTTLARPVQLASTPGEEGYDLWLLDTISRRWQHLPDFPAADVVAKATDLAWTRDGRLVVLTGTATLGQVVAVWRPGQPRLAIRPVTLPEPSPGTSTLAIW